MIFDGSFNYQDHYVTKYKYNCKAFCSKLLDNVGKRHNGIKSVFISDNIHQLAPGAILVAGSTVDGIRQS